MLNVVHSYLLANVGTELTPDSIRAIMLKISTSIYAGPRTAPFAPMVSGSYEFSMINAALELDSIMHLNRQHWEEDQSNNCVAGEYVPNYSQLIDYAMQGRYVVFIVKHIPTQTIVGKMGLYIKPRIHTDVLIAEDEAFFIQKEHRCAGRMFLKFMQYVERSLYAFNVGEIYLTSVTRGGVDRIMAKYGFTPVSTNLHKFTENPNGV